MYLPLYYSLSIIILICATFAGGIYFFKLRKKSIRSKRVITASALSDEELRIIQIIRDIMNIKDTKVYVYKGLFLWKDFMTSCNLPETVKGVTLRDFDEIHIRRYGDTDSDKTFAQLVLHEFNHIKGMEHSAAMTAEDIRLTKLTFEKLGYL